MSLLYFWISAMIIFLIIEALTATFYGLSLAIASGAVALYVWSQGLMEIDIIQGFLFAIITFLVSYFLPRLLTPADSHDVAQGVDVYIGQKRKVKKVGDTFKISLDGVEYIVLGDDIESGDSVIVTGKKGAGFIVEKAQ